MLSISNSDKLMSVQMLFLCTKIVKYFRCVDYFRSYEFFCEKLLFCKSAQELHVKSKQRQCSYNVILRRVHATTVAVGAVLHILTMCVCSLMYSACNAHAPYCHLWHVWLYHIFPPIISQAAQFLRGGITEHKMCILIFSTTFLWNISHSKKNWDR